MSESNKTIHWHSGPMRLRTIVHWNCPFDGCDGEMKATGEAWMTRDPGYHHICDKCGNAATIRGKYPYVQYAEDSDQ